ncbi:putative quinol monooxygenase [Massilia cavernae]|uniref:Antibiotic biosynthesis monooxygenase n=1 Tax=Massilia cavernae TaxID=2320864 RepID=A0A418Y4R3_9BURK|nr:hypothetical protein D3872_07540 [Massilia cavernae]
MVTQGLLARLEAKPGKDDEVEEFLKSVLPLARDESGTTAWFAVRFGRNEYGILDFFPDEATREAHLNGTVAAAILAQVNVLFTAPPKIQKLAVLADKLPLIATYEYSTKGLLLTFKAKSGHEQKVEQFLRDAQRYVDDEPLTTSWFALRIDETHYGIFDTFGGTAGRFDHLTGRVPRDLALHALTLLGGAPHIDLLDVLAEKVIS